MNTRKKRGKERGREIEEKEMKKTRELIENSQMKQSECTPSC